MKYKLLILGIILLVFSTTNGQKSNHNNDKLQSKINAIIAKNKFNGIVYLTKDDAVLFDKALGYSDIEKKTSIKLDDQFVIGSISKQITAVLVLREYEKGKIRLQDKINQYLSIDQPWSKEVTIHQLLTHTHGIIDLDKPLEFEQGAQFHYSQLGYELLAKILEKVSSKTFEELATELFEQHGLVNTFHPENKVYKNLVKGYEENENGILNYCSNSLSNYAAAGSFISNVQDLTRWNQLLHSGKLVKKETLQMMKTRFATRIHPVFETIEYGYGLLFKKGKEKIQIGALGYAPGFVSACYYYPQTNSNLIILENTAYQLNDFKRTFKVQTEIMKLITKQRSN